MRFNSLFLLLVLLTGLLGCSQGTKNGNTQIRLKVKNASDELIYLQKIMIDDLVFVDSMRLDENGEANFAFDVKDFDFFYLSNEKNEKIMLLLEKGEKAIVFTDAKKFNLQYTIEDSKGSESIRILEHRKLAAITKLDSLGKMWIKQRYTDDNINTKQIFDSIGENTVNDHKQFLKDFISNNHKSPASIIAAYQYLRKGMEMLSIEDDTEYFKMISESLEEKYPENEHVRDFAYYYNEFINKKDYAVKAEQNLEKGNFPPQLILYNTSGNRIDLASFKGKYTLLYFWDARHQACYDLNKELLELYAKYRWRKFDIYGVYVGEEKQLMQNTINLDKISWTNVFSNTMVEKEYNITTVPRMFLLDKDGRIRNKDISLDELKGVLPYILPAVKSKTDSTQTIIETTED